MKAYATAARWSLALLAITVFAGTSKIDCVPVEPEEPVCVVPLDCESLPHIACGGEWTCDEGACVWECTPEVPPGCCAKSEECPNGAFCLEGTCEQLPAPGKCFADSDCADNETCFGAIVCPCGVQCFAATTPGNCTAKEEIECSNDADCPAGEYCTGVADCPDCVYQEPACKMPCLMKFICLPPETDCTEIDPAGYGLCEMLMGWGFDGKSCVAVSGCGCGDCAGIFSGIDECNKVCGLF